MALRRNKKNPDERGFSRNDQKKMLAADTPFVIKEAYNTIRTSLLFTQKGESCPIFVVTSPDANNGKTINTINLAISFAQMGKRTLIIDSDMRNPTVHRMFNIPVTNGLSEILAGLTDNITVSKTNVENLSILSSGKIPPNPAELLASSRMDLLLSFVKGHYDCVFIDTPPINLVTDASAFAGKVTGYVMIVKAGNTDIPEVRSAVDALESIGAEVVGFILNDATPDRKKYYSYYNKYGRKYKYGYDSPESFSRAFTRFHGVTPSQARQAGAALKSFSPLSVKLILDGGNTMNYRIETVDAFQLICKKWKQESGKTELPVEEISRFWQACMADGTIDALCRYIPGRPVFGDNIVGASLGRDAADPQYPYAIGAHYNGLPVTDPGLTVEEIPAHTYVVFPCSGKMPEALQALYVQICSEFFPGSEYQPCGGADFEAYPSADVSNPDYACEIWVAVEKK